MRSTSGLVISLIAIPREAAIFSASFTRSSISMRVAMNSAVAGTLARSASSTELRPERTSAASAALLTRSPERRAAPAEPAVLAAGAKNSPRRELSRTLLPDETLVEPPRPVVRAVALPPAAAALAPGDLMDSANSRATLELPAPLPAVLMPRALALRSAACFILKALWFLRSSAFGVGPLPASFFLP